MAGQSRTERMVDCMGAKLFCKHVSYDVLKWHYENEGMYNQYITAKIKCKLCGKVTEKRIEGDTCRAFAVVYADQYDSGLPEVGSVMS